MTVMQGFVIGVVFLVIAVACNSSDEAEQRFNEGLDADEAGRLEEAVALYAEAIQLNPGDAHYSASLAWTIYNVNPSDESNRSEAVRLLKHATEEPPKPSDVNPRDIPYEVESLILECLAKSADDRPQSAKEIMDRLKALRSEIVDPKVGCDGRKR